MSHTHTKSSQCFLLGPQRTYNTLNIHISLADTKGEICDSKRPQTEKMRLKMNGVSPSLLSQAGSPVGAYH